MSSINQKTIEQILNFGTFYCPANKHYSGTKDVSCDYCHKDMLNMCIGFEMYDLCFECIQIIAITTSEKNTLKQESVFDKKRFRPTMHESFDPKFTKTSFR